MRIAHISDFHFTRISWNPFRLLSKRFLGNVNWLFGRRKHFFERQLEPLPQLLKELKVDLLLIGGDLTTTALHEEFEKAKRFLGQMEIPFLAIPGNHDRYTYRSCRNKHFYRHFAHERKAIAHPVEFFNLKEHRIEAHQMSEGWWVILLDTALATNAYSSEGLFSMPLEAYLEEVLKLIPQTDSILILNHYPFFKNGTERHKLIRGDALEAINRKDQRIRLYLHGHTHRHTVADLQVSGLPIVLDSGSCAQGRKGAWNLIDIEKEGCKISTYRWDHKWMKTRTEEFKWKR